MYDDLIRVLDAERVLADTGSSGPEQIGWAVEVTTGSRLEGQRAAATARLRRAVREKGC